MDLFTQGILGSAVAQAGFQRKLGRRSVLWGALVAMIPDADIIARFFSNDPLVNIIHHRGFTHSLWFAPLFAPLFGYLIYAYYKFRKVNDLGSIEAWSWLCFWALITHPLLDVFTVYGTQLLAPLSQFRFYFSSIPIVEPIYSGVLLIAVLMGIILHQRKLTASLIPSFALLLTTAYLFWGLELNSRAEVLAQEQLEQEGIQISRLNAFTTFLSMDKRRVVFQTPNETRIGFISTWNPHSITWKKYANDAALLAPEFMKCRSFLIFKWFTNQNILVQKDDSKLRVYDVRYGSDASSYPGMWGMEFALPLVACPDAPFKWFQEESIRKRVFEKILSSSNK